MTCKKERKDYRSIKDLLRKEPKIKSQKMLWAAAMYLGGFNADKKSTLYR